jgi:uncharacterized protein (DUF2236 family)
MFIGGIRALLMQSLHPVALQAVADQAGFRRDFWGRFQRTSRYLAITTYGTVPDAERAIAVVRAIHRRVTGRSPDGRWYSAEDPHLLMWVHVAEVDSFLKAFQVFGAEKLSAAEADEYVCQMAARVRPLERLAICFLSIHHLRALLEPRITFWPRAPSRSCRHGLVASCGYQRCRSPSAL